jgi:hypothetical protein
MDTSKSKTSCLVSIAWKVLRDDPRVYLAFLCRDSPIVARFGRITFSTRPVGE